MNNMFCYQCEQAANGIGCTVVGVTHARSARHAVKLQSSVFRSFPGTDSPAAFAA